MTFTVLKLSTPASPRRDVKLTKTWRLAWVDVTLAQANALLDQVPTWQQARYKLVPSADVRKYL